MLKEKTNCALIEACPFFNTLFMNSTAETLKTLFCRGNYENCHRWQLRQSGEDVPKDLWPNGHRPSRPEPGQAAGRGK